MRILTSGQMKAAEQRANDKGMAFIRLMENAGCACARIVRDRLRNEPGSKKAVIVCGSGKNGGDGFVIARKLSEYGFDTAVILASGLPKDSDSSAMFRRLEGMPVVITDYTEKPAKAFDYLEDADIIIDAIFGTGFHGTPDASARQIIEAVNSGGSFIISIDIPSGLECDSGESADICVHADLTVAISALKPVHVLVPAALNCGEVVEADIGISDDCYRFEESPALFTMNKLEAKRYFPAMNPAAHKGERGHVLSICGSRNMQGAACLAAAGAVRSGAGLVTAAFPECAFAAIGPKLIEPLLLPLSCNEQGTFSTAAVSKLLQAAEKANAVLIGCGLGLNADTKTIVREILLHVTVPIIIDADGINALSANINMLRAAKGSVTVTPHPGEMSRLVNASVSDIQKARVRTAKEFADNYGVITVLKGANTVVAQPGCPEVFINSSGNSGMAKGGSGDLLAGIMASFCAQGISPGVAAGLAVYIHGLAGDAAALKRSKRGMTPSDCLNELPYLLSEFE